MASQVFFVGQLWFCIFINDVVEVLKLSDRQNLDESEKKLVDMDYMQLSPVNYSKMTNRGANRTVAGRRLVSSKSIRAPGSHL